MPNQTIYLNDDEYVKFIQLSEDEQTKRKEQAKKLLVK